MKHIIHEEELYFEIGIITGTRFTKRYQRIMPRIPLMNITHTIQKNHRPRQKKCGLQLQGPPSTGLLTNLDQLSSKKEGNWGELKNLVNSPSILVVEGKTTPQSFPKQNMQCNIMFMPNLVSIRNHIIVLSSYDKAYKRLKSKRRRKGLNQIFLKDFKNILRKPSQNRFLNMKKIKIQIFGLNENGDFKIQRKKRGRESGCQVSIDYIQEKLSLDFKIKGKPKVSKLGRG